MFHQKQLVQPNDASLFLCGLSSKGWTRELLKPFFNGSFEEKELDKGSLSGAITVTLTDAMNQTITITETSTINIVTTGMTYKWDLVLTLYMTAVRAVTWQVNGVNQTAWVLSLNSNGKSEIHIRNSTTFNEYYATRTM